jgi:hypothetical protein
MSKLRAALLVGCVLVGVLIGAAWRGRSVQAQSPRFRTERHGELLFIRYFNSVTGVDCFLGMDATGIVSVPCDRDVTRR